MTYGLWSELQRPMLAAGGARPTVVSSSRSERSKVTLEGTATLDRTTVTQSFWDTLAREAPFEPENVQLEARFLRLSAAGAGVTIGSAIGEEKA